MVYTVIPIKIGLSYLHIFMVYTSHLFLILGTRKALAFRTFEKLPKTAPGVVPASCQRLRVQGFSVAVRLMSSSSHLIAVHLGLTMNICLLIKFN